MTTSEFSNEFDILYNSVMSNQAPSLDEYEKSVFLTLAQKELVQAYFNPRTNKTQEGFDLNKKRLMDFSKLIKTKLLSKIDKPIDLFDKRSLVYLLPEDALYIVNELGQDSKYRYIIDPITFTEYDRYMLKPFQLPAKRSIWRLMTDPVFYAFEQTFTLEPYNINVGDLTNTKLVLTNISDKRLFVHIDKCEDTDEGVYSNYGKAPIVTVKGEDVYIEYWVSLKCDAICDYLSTFVGLFDDKQYLSTLSHDHTKLPNWTPKAIPDGGYDLVVKPNPYRTSVELIGSIKDKDTFDYTIRYVKKPNPIILESLENTDLTIDGRQELLLCELDSELHREILIRAVELAKAAYSGDLSALITVGNSSATQLGIIPTQQER